MCTCSSCSLSHVRPHCGDGNLLEISEELSGLFLGALATYDVLDWTRGQCTFRKLVTESSLGMLANSREEISHELRGVVTWWCTNGINVAGGKRRFEDLRRVEVQFEPLMSLCRFLDLEAPLVIFAIISDFSTHYQLRIRP